MQLVTDEKPNVEQVDEDNWAVELEWAIANDLILDTAVGEVNKSADLFWEYRW